jgi:hypothetical protein
MQTNGISAKDNWVRFMQLSSEARLRNQGLAGGVEGVRRTAAAQKTHPTQRAEVKAVKVTAPLPQTPAVGLSYAITSPAANVRILGGKFDAYA